MDKHYDRGKEYREWSDSAKELEARKLLKKRLGEIGRGRLLGPSERRVTFEQLKTDLLRDFETNGKRSIQSAKLSIRHLDELFSLERASDITTDRIRTYISQGKLKTVCKEGNLERGARSRLAP